MTATSSNSTPPASTDWLDALLAGNAADDRAGYIGDEGFTARVMQRLPAPDALPAWRRPIVATLWLVAGLLIATMLPGTAHEVARELFTLFAARPFSLSTLGFAIIVVGIATWTAAALALRRD
jgi:hypothetical protein